MDAPLTQSLQARSETELAYFAGIIDGEGTIGIYKLGRSKSQVNAPVHYFPTVIVVQRDELIPQWIHERFGGSLAHKVFRIRGGKRDRYTYWRWTIHGKAAGAMLKPVLPYLMLKKRQAELAIQFADTLLPGGKQWYAFPADKIISRGRAGRAGRPLAVSDEHMILRKSLYLQCSQLNSPSIPEGEP